MVSIKMEISPLNSFPGKYLFLMVRVEQKVSKQQAASNSPDPVHLFSSRICVQVHQIKIIQPVNCGRANKSSSFDGTRILFMHMNDGHFNYEVQVCLTSGTYYCGLFCSTLVLVLVCLRFDRIVLFRSFGHIFNEFLYLGSNCRSTQHNNNQRWRCSPEGYPSHNFSSVSRGSKTVTIHSLG